MTYPLQFHLQKKALDAAMNDINNSFGKGSVTRLGSAGGAFVYVLNFLIYQNSVISSMHAIILTVTVSIQ